MCYREQIPFPQLSPSLWTHRSITSCSFSPLLSPLQICLVENSVLGTGIQGVYKALRELVLRETTEFILIQLSLLVLSYKFSL